MKIFGLGLSRTGTTSLTEVLRSYGFNVIHYPNKQQLFSPKNDGATDIPVISYYKELDKKFPNSKFIYTLRDKDSWLESIETYFIKKEKRGDKFSAWQIEHRKKVYGQVNFNRKLFSKRYDEHDSDVRSYFKNRPNDLLILDIVGGDPIEKLAGFLGLDMKGANTPFPKENIKDPKWLTEK